MGDTGSTGNRNVAYTQRALAARNSINIGGGHTERSDNTRVTPVVVAPLHHVLIKGFTTNSKGKVVPLSNGVELAPTYGNTETEVELSAATLKQRTLAAVRNKALRNASDDGSLLHRLRRL